MYTCVTNLALQFVEPCVFTSGAADRPAASVGNGEIKRKNQTEYTQPHLLEQIKRNIYDKSMYESC